MKSNTKVYNPFGRISSHELIWTDYCLVRAGDIVYIDISTIEEQQIAVYTTIRDDPFLVTGFASLELIWRLKPGVLEGKRFRWAKNGWIFHNMVAHPVMQILAFVKCYKAAMWVHDITVPRPIGFK